jgi:4-oxalocrotonate tautomerase
MPHILVKLATGKSELQKRQLTDRIVQDVLDVLHCEEAEISVALEEVPREDWMTSVYAPDIRLRWDSLYKKPGYAPS